MKRIALAILVAACFTFPAPAELPFAQDRIGWNKPAAPFPIIGNIYYVGTAGLSVHLIATPAGLILIDQGLPESVPEIEENIARLGFKLTDVKLLLAGHAHFDHVGGLAALQHDSGAKVVAMAEDKPYLESGHIPFGPCRDVPTVPVKVDRTVRDGDSVSLGGTTLTAHRTGGHTPGATSWSMTVTEGGKAYRVLFASSTSTGGNPLVTVPEYKNIVADYRHSFAWLKSVKADVLLTEHQDLSEEIARAGRAKQGAPNPFIDPTALPRYVAASEAAFDKELARQRP
ncbi:MAG: subclass B3 metallo-beta-lactamase [Rhizomicrobium sp.]|nr:subclass B3 metallo-beta-lactamase [Rhizomicrobium sp.]